MRHSRPQDGIREQPHPAELDQHGGVPDVRDAAGGDAVGIVAAERAGRITRAG